VGSLGGLNVAADIDVMDVRFHGASPYRLLRWGYRVRVRETGIGCACDWVVVVLFGRRSERATHFRRPCWVT
jgi:hypothetical protein